MTNPIHDRRIYWGVMAAGLVLAGALGYHVVYGEHGYLTYRTEQRQFQELKVKTDRLKNGNEALQKEIDGLNRHDRALIEEKAREQQYARHNEKIYTYTPQDSKPGGAGPQPASPPPVSSGQP
jgi:cell division protein FtsB